MSVQGQCDVRFSRLLSQFLTRYSESTGSGPFRKVEPEEAIRYREIDKGLCGIVFEAVGTGLVVKKAIEHSCRSILNEAVMHRFLYEDFAGANRLFKGCQRQPPRIPEFHGFTRSSHRSWWEQNRLKFDELHRSPQDILMSERIMQIERGLREALIRSFCPCRAIEGTKASLGSADCIVRLYLGRHKPLPGGRSAVTFSPRIFPLHLDQALEMGLDVKGYAQQMAIGLAICHWRTKVDACGVDFILGDAIIPSKNTPCLYTYLWMIDFDLCKEITWDKAGIEQAVQAAENNDPYFPKPQKQEGFDNTLWGVFAHSYLEASKMIFHEDGIEDKFLSLPSEFLRRWEEYRAEKMKRRGTSATDIGHSSMRESMMIQMGRVRLAMDNIFTLVIKEPIMFLLITISCVCCALLVTVGFLCSALLLVFILLAVLERE